VSEQRNETINVLSWAAIALVIGLGAIFGRNLWLELMRRAQFEAVMQQIADKRLVRCGVAISAAPLKPGEVGSFVFADADQIAYAEKHPEYRIPCPEP
jgi:hypothetical protein